MRWRPAKAFLLDERGVVLHEFALDPACGVTVREAIAAGAILAEGAAIRVGRYHAQTLRTNGAALVVVSQAPAEPAEIELTRQLLLWTRATLAETVKDRLELARTEEARLEAERRRLAAQAADVGARARGVAGFHEASSAAHGRLATAAASLETRYAALVAGESSLAEREAALARRGAEIHVKAAEADAAAELERTALEMLRAELAAKGQAVDEKAAINEERLAALEANARAVAEREAGVTEARMGLSQRERELEARESESESFFQELSVKVAKTAKWEGALRATATELERRAKELGVDLDVPRREPEPAKGKRAVGKR
jgi:hypothetical protein